MYHSAELEDIKTLVTDPECMIADNMPNLLHLDWMFTKESKLLGTEAIV